MKILMVTANFAPRGASPAIRTVNLVKYLTASGFVVKVITYDEKTLTLFSPPDPILISKVPAGVEVVRVHPGPLRKYLSKRMRHEERSLSEWKESINRSLMISLLIPDPHVDAMVNFFIHGVRQIKDFVPDIMLTHGYPFSMHIVGSLLKRRYPHIRWIADYGDPWSGNPVSELPRPRWRQWLDYRLEETMLKVVDWVTVTTEATKQLYEIHFPFLVGRISVIPMGFDHEEIKAVTPFPRPPGEESRIWFVYTGRLYPEARDPKSFIQAVATLIQKDPSVVNRLRVFLVGEVHPTIKRLICGAQARYVFRFVKWGSVAESIAWMKTADYLLLFGNKGGIQVPGKVYQYIGTGKPIFMTVEVEKDPTVKVVLSNPLSIIIKNESSQILARLISILYHGRAVAPRPVQSEIENSPYVWVKIAHEFVKLAKDLVDA